MTRRRKALPKSRRPVPELERARIIAARNKLIAREEELGKAVGPTDKEFAAQHGISISTLHRWVLATPKNLDDGPETLSDVSESIRVLTNESAEEWDLIAAVANFSSWLVYPRSYLNRCARTLSLIAMRFGNEDDLRNINQLPATAQTAVGRFLSLMLLKKLSSADKIIWGDFEYAFHRNTDFTDRDVLKAVANQFFNAKSRREISINKVERLIEDGELLPGISMGAEAFSSFWKNYASTIPYLKAEEATGINWHLTLDGESEGRFSALSCDTKATSEFFKAADSYVDRFRLLLDRRAWNNLVMPHPHENFRQ